MTATKNTAATVARARQLVHAAADVGKQLEETIRELVTMRAWDVLGYANFAEMWEKENGFKWPVYVRVLALAAMRDERMNTSRSGETNGHTTGEVATALGLPTHVLPNGTPVSSAVSAVFKQLDHGVPPERVVQGGGGGQAVNRTIDKFGTRARSRPRRMGKTPDELVNEGFYLPRRDADAIGVIAREADVPKSEIYRQAVAEYLARHRESRPGHGSDWTAAS